MNLIESISRFFTINKPAEESKGNSPEGVCPNCWGEQEYGNTVRKMYIDKQIDVSNENAHHSFIQKFVVDHISGIQLKKGNKGYECPTCKVNFEE